jgi:WD40 repeat protein
MDVKQTHVAHDLVHNSPLTGCRFDPSGKYVFAFAQDYNVWRFEIATGNKVAYPVESWGRGIAFDVTGKFVITATYDGRLVWWPVEGDKLEPVRTVEAHKGWIRAIAVSSQGVLASVGNDLAVRLWDQEGKKIREMTGHESQIYNVAFHPSGEHLATGDLMANLIHWETATGKQARTWKAESLQKFDKTFVATIGGFRGMTFSPDGRFVACSGITNVTNAFAGVGNPSVVVFDWETGKQQIEHLSKAKVQGVAWGVVIHPDGTRIAATGGSGGFLLFFKPDEANEMHSLKLKDNARDLDLSPDHLHLAAAHFNGHISVCRMEAKAE